MKNRKENNSHLPAAEGTQAGTESPHVTGSPESPRLSGVEIWELMAQRIYKQCAFVLIPAAAVSLFFLDWQFPLSILVGGLIGIGHLKGIIWAVKSLLGVELARAKMIALSMFKVLVIFSVLLILVILKAINLYGLLIGFTVVLIVIIKEGLIASKQSQYHNP